MIITMPSIKAPECQCGEKAKVYLSPNDLKVRCPQCGKEANVHYTSGFYRFSVDDLVELMSIIGNKA
nr:MAG TPA: DNA-directed RNA polymerase [Caudoviricetes sp.]